MNLPSVHFTPAAQETIRKVLAYLEGEGNILDRGGIFVLGFPTFSEGEGQGMSWVEIPPKHWNADPVVNESLMVH